jgi:serine/threonine-protein kinase
MTERPTTRRRFLAVAAAAGAAGAAGCLGGDSGNTPTVSGEYGDAASRVVEYLQGSAAARNFDGEFADATGQSETVVEVGAEGNGGNLAYAPPALRISTGTTVSFEWTGRGGSHNVLSTADSDIEIDSGAPVVEREPFERTFEEAGVALYYCTPHRSLGMKGGILVE